MCVCGVFFSPRNTPIFCSFVSDVCFYIDSLWPGIAFLNCVKSIVFALPLVFALAYWVATGVLFEVNRKRGGRISFHAFLLYLHYIFWRDDTDVLMLLLALFSWNFCFSDLISIISAANFQYNFLRVNPKLYLLTHEFKWFVYTMNAEMQLQTRLEIKCVECWLREILILEKKQPQKTIIIQQLDIARRQFICLSWTLFLLLFPSVKWTDFTSWWPNFGGFEMLEVKTVVTASQLLKASTKKWSMVTVNSLFWLSKPNKLCRM